MYAILDIETTGGKYNEEGITEIAIYRFDGKKITDQFISLVNPEKEIQPFVVKLTGINSRMLKTAPRFFEVAKRIVEITEDAIIVAHNAQFDYRILQTEFRRLGFDYQRQSLCTVELSQKLLPEQESYSLGKLVRSMGIPVSDRHRANGDALATIELFKVLLNKDKNKEILTNTVRTASTGILSQRLLDIVNEMPSSLGVYYMHNDNGEVIFIEKSGNLQKGLTRKFTSHSKKLRAMQKEMRAVTYEETGSPLIASLKEESEIKATRPKYNRKSKKHPVKFVLEKYISPGGYSGLEIKPYSRQTNVAGYFASEAEASVFLASFTKKNQLCLKINSLSDARKQCSAYTEGDCLGACIDAEHPANYNARLEQALQKVSLGKQNLIISGKGRATDEKSAILVEKGKIIGYAYTKLNHQLHSPEIIRSLISPLKHTLNTAYLVEQYLRKNKIPHPVISF